MTRRVERLTSSDAFRDSLSREARDAFERLFGPLRRNLSLEPLVVHHSLGDGVPLEDVTPITGVDSPLLCFCFVVFLVAGGSGR